MKEPTLVPGLPPISKLAAGTSHVLALSTEGEVFTWGAAAQGQTGQENDSASGAFAYFAVSWEPVFAEATMHAPLHSNAFIFLTNGCLLGMLHRQVCTHACTHVLLTWTHAALRPFMASMRLDYRSCVRSVASMGLRLLLTAAYTVAKTCTIQRYSVAIPEQCFHFLSSVVSNLKVLGVPCQYLQVAKQ